MIALESTTREKKLRDILEEVISIQASKLDHVEQLPCILLLEAANMLHILCLKPVKEFANILKIIIGWNSESYTKKHILIEQS